MNSKWLNQCWMLGSAFLLLGLSTACVGETNVVSSSLAQVTQVEAATLTTLLVDRNDDPQGSFECTPNQPQDCTLRQAIELANEDDDETLIQFADHLYIQLERALPQLTANNTIIRAEIGQEVHVNGENAGSGSLFYITGNHVEISGLRIYGASEGFSQIRITGEANGVVIADNVIGDDDAPANRCEHGDKAYGGIFLDSTGGSETAVQAWIYGNIIECHRGNPGQGISIMTGHVIVGKSEQGLATASERNVIRFNNGDGIFVDKVLGVTVQNGRFHNNGGLPYNFTIPGNDVFDNEILESNE